MKLLRSFISYLIVFFLTLIVLLVPDRLIEYMSRPISVLLYLIFRGERKRSLNNLKKILELDAKQARRLNRRIFHQATMTLLEFLTFPWLTSERIEKMVDFSELPRLETLISQTGRGAILVTAHLGNWELLAAALARRGFRVNAVAAEQDSKIVDNILTRYRRRHGLKIIRRGMELRRAFRALSKGEVLLMLCDQHGGDEGINIDFLGRKTSCPPGPAIFSQRMKVPVIPVFLIRRGYATHYLRVDEKAVRSEKDESGEPGQQIVTITEKINRILESYILAHPEQWMWMNNRWKEWAAEEE